MKQKFSFASCWRVRANQPAIALVISGILLVVVSGCRIPRLSGPQPGPDLPGDFIGAVSPENSAHLGIDEFFNDPVLTTLILRGLSQNQELMIRNQEVEIARNEILARRGRLPSVCRPRHGGRI